jgi:hypothetical protein
MRPYGTLLAVRRGGAQELLSAGGKVGLEVSIRDLVATLRGGGRAPEL